MGLLDQFGQSAIRRQWDTVLEQGKLPHAILLYGEPGSGILPGALSLANDILCKSQVKGRACRECPSCNRAQKWIHPDLHFLLPLAGAKSLTVEYLDHWREAMAANPWLNIFQWTQFAGVEGKQVDIHKEDIQHVTKDLCLQSFEGGNKVLIIWMAQFLTKEGNRLLKMIEEPPEHTYFILVTNQREHILPTIRSRCMQCFFPPLSDTDIGGILHLQHKVEKTAAERISQLAGNDMNKALALSQNSILNFKDELAAWFRIMLARKSGDMAGWSSKMGSQEKEEQKQFALYAMGTIRDILRPASHLQFGVKGDEMTKYMHEHFHPEVWQHIMEAVQIAYEKISRNANTKLMWMAMTIAIKNHLAAYRYQHINQ